MIEAIYSDLVCFIENDFDKDHKIFTFSDFLYVTSGDELEKKILELKNNNNLYYDILSNQKEVLKTISTPSLGKILKDILL